MNYFLYKLRFLTPVHFGASDSALSLPFSENHFLADTLFSALCHEALKLYGEEGLNKLYTASASGKLLLSDSMPWRDERFFLPKPCYAATRTQESENADRKAFKSLQWIPADAYEAFLNSLKGNSRFVIDESMGHFGSIAEMTKATICDGEDTVPYQVGIYSFHEGCGLYFIASLDEEISEERLTTLITGLGMTGIGGKTSSGYGKFEVDDVIFLNEPFDDQTKWLSAALQNAQAAHHLLLTTSLPTDEELENVFEGASFQLTRRGGFAVSDGTDTQRKKRTQYFLAAGAVLNTPFAGAIYDVGGSSHSVYRYSKPILLGVSL